MNITILDGFIQGGVTNNGSGVYNGTGFQHGIYYPSTYNGQSFVGYPANTRVVNVSVSGCLGNGIYLNYVDSTVVESCTVRTVGSSGICASVVKNSAALDCGSTGIFGFVVSDCRGQSAGGYGVYGTTALNCYGTSTTGYGISAYDAQNCNGSGPSAYGVSAYTAQACSGYSLNSIGLYAYNLATSCFGQTSGSTALYAYNAAFCTGNVYEGTAVQAFIATGCIASPGSTNSITYKYPTCRDAQSSPQDENLCGKCPIKAYSNRSSVAGIAGNPQVQFLYFHFPIDISAVPGKV